MTNNKPAQDACSVAEAGGHTVQDVVTTMESISARSSSARTTIQPHASAREQVRIAIKYAAFSAF